jgi:uncharacterized delta-60 repeat protein
MTIGLASEAPAAATPRLDPTFGVGGRVLTALDIGDPKFWFGARVHAAQTPDGRILVLADELFLRYLPTGKLDRSFAQDGRLRIEKIKGKSSAPGDMAVDSQGRIVVTGGNGEEQIVVRRFTPDGSPDLSFGGGDGIAVTDFGLGALDNLPAATASLWSAGLAVDGAGRIVVSGSMAMSQTSSCVVVDSFVGRLNAIGDVDPTFGNGGATTFGFSSNAVTEDVIGADAGASLFLGGAGGTCRGGGGPNAMIGRLTADGSLDPAFGSEGWVTLSGFPGRIALDNLGRILVLSSRTLLRLLPSGAIDSSFGHNGVARIPIRGHLSALRDLAVTPAGGVVTVGTQTHYVHRSERRRLVVARVGPQGRLGNRGILKLRFGRASNTNGKQILLDDDGHATVVGMVRDRQIATGEGLALYRLDLGR